MADKNFTYTIEIKSEKLDEMTKLQTKIDAIKAAQKQLKDTNQQGSAEWQKNQAELKKTQTQLSATHKSIQQADQATKFQKGSMEQLSAELAKNRAAYKALSEEERNNIEIGGKLLISIQEQDAKIKELDGTVGLHQRNVGDYAGQLGGLPGLFGKIGEGITSFKDKFAALSENKIFSNPKAAGEELKGVWTGISSGIGQATKAALKFIATPIGMVLAAVAAAFAVFTRFIQRNNDAANKLKEIWGGITGVLGAIEGALFGHGQNLKEAYNQGKKLVEIQNKLKDTTANLGIAVASLNKDYERANIIADDTTRSFAEREEAQKKSAELSKKVAEETFKRRDAELEAAKLELQISKEKGEVNRELEKQFLEALTARTEAEAELTRGIQEEEKRRRELRQDRLEQDLDYLIDGFDNTKTINEKIIADETKTYEERKKLLDEIRKLADESFAAQTEIVNQLSNQQVDVNKLLTLNNTELIAYVKTLGASEIANTRILEILRERKIVIQDLSDAQKQLELTTKESAEKRIEDLEKELEKITELQDEKAESDYEKQKELREQTVEDQKELNVQLEILYNDLTGGRISQINAQYKAEKEAIQKSLADEKTKADAIRLLDKTTTKLKLEAAKQSTTEIMGYLEEGTIAYKAFALLQVGLDTATAISALTTMSEANPANAFTFGAAGALQFAAGIIRILANIGQATAIISKFEKGGEIGGKPHSQGGTMIEAEAGEVVINKRSAAKFKPILSEINQWGGGVPIGKPISKIAASGGLVARSSGITQAANININNLSEFEIQNIVDRTINSMNIVLPISEVNRIQKRVSVIETQSSL